MAIKLAQWLSPDFEVVVTGWVFELLATGTVTVKPSARRRRYERMGKPSGWVELREETIEARHTFTGVLKEHKVEGAGYALCTNAIYKPILGGTAKEVRAARQAPATAELRDVLPDDDLAAVRLAGLLAAKRIEVDEAAGNDECESACGLVAEALAVFKSLALAGRIPEPSLN